MEMYAAYYPPGYDFPISTLFWGAAIFVALVAAWLLVGNAIKRQRNRRRSGGEAVEEGHRREREEEEFLLKYGPRKVRKAIRERRNVREQAQKNQSQS